MATTRPAGVLAVPINIDTPNFVMRSLSAHDATAAWGAWFDDPEVAEALNLPRRRRSKEEMEAYVASFDQRHDLLLGIFERSTDLLVGILTVYVNWAQRAFLANTVVGEAPFRGRGVMMELTPPFRDYFFETRGLEVMVANALARNAPIRAYLEKTGWTLVRTAKRQVKSVADGTMLDLCSYSLTRDAWRAWKAAHLGTLAAGAAA
jgi:RimJ/RimL family protein N-acetyltransferase